jgi:hypothetical protein
VEWFPIESFYVILLYVLFGKNKFKKQSCRYDGWSEIWHWVETFLGLRRKVRRRISAYRFSLSSNICFFLYLFCLILLIFCSFAEQVLQQMWITLYTSTRYCTLPHLVQLIFFIISRERSFSSSCFTLGQNVTKINMECLLARNKIRKLNFANFGISASWWLRKWQFM